jgi:hypothetical protein
LTKKQYFTESLLVLFPPNNRISRNIWLSVRFELLTQNYLQKAIFHQNSISSVPSPFIKLWTKCASNFNSLYRVTPGKAFFRKLDFY